MADQRLLMRALSEFAGTLAEGYSVSDVLHDLAEQVTAVLGVDGAGVSVQDGDELHFVTALDERCAMLEGVQEAGQAGPCVDAWRSGKSVVVADLRDYPHSWGGYEQAARKAGVVALAGVPMRCGSQSIGTLDLYSTTPRQWSDDDLECARILADMATSYVIHASELDRQRRLVGQLREALDSRIVIEQAKGIVAAERQVSVDAAFELLRRHARSHSAPLRSVAEAVVNLGLRPLSTAGPADRSRLPCPCVTLDHFCLTVSDCVSKRSTSSKRPHMASYGCMVQF
jgi:GAF domain-containing protein